MPNQVRKWVITVHRRGLVSNTVVCHLYALRSFWDYLLGRVVSEGYPQTDRPCLYRCH